MPRKTQAESKFLTVFLNISTWAEFSAVKASSKKKDGKQARLAQTKVAFRAAESIVESEDEVQNEMDIDDEDESGGDEQ